MKLGDGGGGRGGVDVGVCVTRDVMHRPHPRSSNRVLVMGIPWWEGK